MVPYVVSEVDEQRGDWCLDVKPGYMILVCLLCICVCKLFIC